ncbi:MAG: patatin-like phospholipase family protein [Acidobacteria bacterium]|nr:patatin-like phospholipase family protein [Acidobacteriota bacterium]
MLFALLWCAALPSQNPDSVVKLIKKEPDYLFLHGPRWAVPHRPRIALALSGGGAKGFIHVGVLQAIQEHGLRIDELAGTSIGALVGGLYAIGLDPDYIERHLKNSDIERLFYNFRARDPVLSFPEQLIDAEALWRLRVRNREIVPNAGLLRSHLLKEALDTWFARANYFSQGDSNALPIPFAPVAVDLQSGNTVYLRHHNLATAIRGSMAVPTGFDPVELDDMVLVDGGILENIPTLALLDRDHDLLIAVDISDRLGTGSTGYSLLSLVNRLQLVYFEKQKHDLLAVADHVISPDVSGLSFTDFSQDPDDLIQRGKSAFTAAWPAIEKDMLKIIRYREQTYPCLSFEVVGENDPTLKAWVQTQFDVRDGKVRLTDLESGLLRVLSSGWYDDGTVERYGHEFRVVLVPYGVVQQTHLEHATGLFEDDGEAIRKLFLGQRFNAVQLEELLLQRLPRDLEDGRVFTDLRGSGFDRSTGILKIEFNTPTVEQMRIVGGDNRAEVVIAEEIRNRFFGQSITVQELHTFASRAERVYALREVALFPRLREDGNVLLDVTLRSEREHAAEFSYGFETHVEHDVSVAYATRLKPPFGAHIRFKLHANRVLRDVEFQLLSEQSLSGRYGVVGFGNWFRQDFREIDLPRISTELSKSEGVNTQIGVFKRFAGTGMGQLTYGFKQVDNLLVDDSLTSDHVHSINFECVWDDLDNFVIPTRGRLVRFRQQWSSDGASHVRCLGELRRFWPLTGRQNVELRGLIGANDDSRRPESLFAAGGADFFMGSTSLSLFLANFANVRLTHRTRLTSILGYELYLDLVADYGVHAQRFSDLLNDENHYGGGVALRTFGNFRNLTVAYGWNAEDGGQVSILFGPKAFSLWRWN